MTHFAATGGQPLMVHVQMATTPRRPAKSTIASRARRAVQLDLFGAPRPASQPFDQKRLTQIALGIFRAAVPVRDTIAEHWFTSRHLAPPNHSVARFHPSLKFGDVRAPAIVWLLRDTKTGEACGILRIFLDSDGVEIARRILGRAVGATLNRAPRPPP